MKKIRLSVECTCSATKELEISDEDYERIKEKGVSATLLSEIGKLSKEAASDETNGFDYKVEDADNDTIIVDWDR